MLLTDICLEFVFCVWRVWFVRQQWVPIEANSSILVNFSLEKQKDIQNKKNIFFLQTLVNTSLKSVQNSWSNRLNDTVQITRYNKYSCLWKKKPCSFNKFILYKQRRNFFWCAALLRAKCSTFLRTPLAAFVQLLDPDLIHLSRCNQLFLPAANHWPLMQVS